MENYMWSAVGVAILGSFAWVYWHVLQAFLAYRRHHADQPANSSPAAAPRHPVVAALIHATSWFLRQADRALHLLLMSPTSR